MQYENNEKNNVISIKYNELKKMINNKESFLFYFGGSWCKNCRAIDYMVHDVSLSNDIKVYNFDPRDKEQTPLDDFRKCNNEKQQALYKEFIELLEYKNDKTVLVEDEFGNEVNTNIPSLAVPALLAIKNGSIESILIEEYEEDEISLEIEDYFKNELQLLINIL